jgi:hypothetical protein
METNVLTVAMGMALLGIGAILLRVADGAMDKILSASTTAAGLLMVLMPLMKIVAALIEGG